MAELVESKWEYLSDVRIKFSELILENEKEFYSLVYQSLKKLTDGMEVVVILSESITYSNHVAVTDKGINDDSSWRAWFDELIPDAGIDKLKCLIWQSTSTIEIDNETDVINSLCQNHVESSPIKSWFSSPLIWDETNIVGAVIIYSKDKENNDKKIYPKKLIESFTKHLAVLLKNKRIFDRDQILVQTARSLYFKVSYQKSAGFDDIVNAILAESYKFTNQLMVADNFLAFVIPENHISTTSQPKLYLAYTNGVKTNLAESDIFIELANYIIQHPKEKFLLQKKSMIKDKLKSINPSLDFEQINLPETLLVVPMSSGENKARGAFILYHPTHKGVYDEDDRKVLDRLSDQAAFAIDKLQSERVKEQTHKERHNALFDMNRVLFKLDSSNLSEKQAIQKVLEIATDHIRKIIANIENVSMFTIHYQNYSDLKENINNPELQLIYEKGNYLFDCSENDLPSYVKEAALRVIRNPEVPLLSKNKQEFECFSFSCENDIPQSFLAVPMRLDKDTASGAFVFHSSADYLYNEDDEQFIDDITDSVALIIKNILVRIEKEKILFGMSRELLKFVKDVGEESNEEIIEKILTTSYDYTQKLAKADNLLIYMRLVDNEKRHDLPLQLKKSYKNRVDVSAAEIAEPIPIQLIDYVADNPTFPILWGSKKEALNKLKDLNIGNFSNIPESLLIVPMSLDVDNSANGVFVLYDFERKNRFENEDKDFMDELSDQIAVIIENLLLNHTKQELEETNKKLEREKILSNSALKIANNIAAGIYSSDDEILEKIHSEADKVINVNNMYIALCDDKKEALKFPLFYMDEKKIIIKDRKFDRGRTEWIINNQESIIIYTRDESIKWYEKANFQSVGDPLASWIGVPIQFKDKVIGVIAAFHPREDYIYDEIDLKILTYLSKQLASELEKTRLNEDLKKLNEDLKSLTRTISQKEHEFTKTLILGDVVHRFNNVAGTVPMWIGEIESELAKEGILDRKEIEFCTLKIKGQYTALKSLTTDLKEGRLTKEQYIDIYELSTSLVDQIKNDYDYLEEQEILKINSTIENPLGTIFASLHAIGQAIYDILINAIDAIEAKKSTKEEQLSISAFSEKFNDIKGVKITIKDTGIGIPENKIKRIFMSDFTSKGGLGHGLYSAERHITKYKGSIHCDSKEGKGTVFTIWLPYSAEEKI